MLTKDVEEMKTIRPGVTILTGPRRAKIGIRDIYPRRVGMYFGSECQVRFVGEGTINTTEARTDGREDAKDAKMDMPIEQEKHTRHTL